MRPEEPAAPASPRLAFVVTEDWFFASHFLPMARAAVELGFEVAVITRVRDHRTTIESVGARVIPLEAERSSLNPVAAGYAAGHLASVLKAWRPDVVHCIALRSILVGGAACAIAGIDARVYALTGLGLIGARADAVGRVARSGIRFLLRGVLESRNTHYLFENKDDPRLLGLDPADASRVTVIGGAGVDPDRITPQPMPPAPPLRIAVVA
ncbi:MAG TPA: glycosyltransferase, partial [Enterovirga sp.]